MTQSRFVLLISVLVWMGCGPQLTPDEEALIASNDRLLRILENWYWWRDEVDLGLDPEGFTTPNELLDAARYSELDRWSFVGDLARYQSFYNNGEFAGYGFGGAWSEDGKLWVRYTYRDSPFGEVGITRGWRFVQIDGMNVEDINDISEVLGPSVAGHSNTFLMENLEGEQREFRLTKRSVEINAVLHREVLDVGGAKVAYMVFNTFVATAEAELDEAFAHFAAEGATELILDLRYNGGGSVDVARYLGNYLAPSSAQGQVFAQKEHLEARSDQDQTYVFDKQGTVELSRITILQSPSSASVSELMINGLNPFMDVVLIGSGATAGKPVGAYAWEHDPYIFSIISFRMINAEGVADYFEGFAPDLVVGDGYAYDWGDPRETMLAAALRYYETGMLGRGVQDMGVYQMREIPYRSRWQEEIGAW